MTKEENIKKRKMLKDKIKEVVKRSKTLDYKIWDLHLLADLRWELKFLQSQLMLLELDNKQWKLH